jgi:hypothetical protein
VRCRQYHYAVTRRLALAELETSLDAVRHLDHGSRSGRRLAMLSVGGGAVGSEYAEEGMAPHH